MNLNNVLNSVLRGGLGSVLGDAGTRGGGLGGGLGGLAGSAAAAAALNMLLRGRGSKLLRLGGMAALGMMAYKAWQEYQAKQGGAGVAPMQPPAAQEAPAQAEAHSRALLVAMIAAAKADGHLDDAERRQIEGALKQGDPEVAAWFDQELKKALDPAEVARAAGGDSALASEFYLASLLLTQADDGHIGFMERSYLDELARQLKLPDGLKATLENQAKQAG